MIINFPKHFLRFILFEISKSSQFILEMYPKCYETTPDHILEKFFEKKGDPFRESQVIWWLRDTVVHNDTSSWLSQIESFSLRFRDDTIDNILVALHFNTVLVPQTKYHMM